MGSNLANPGGMTNPTDEDDPGVGPGFSVNEYYKNKGAINPWWNKAYGG